MEILTIDVGTTSIRGILFDEEGRCRTVAGIPTPLIYDGNHIEQSPQFLAQCLTEICRKAACMAAVDAISVTAYRSAPALFDENGNPLCNFIMWQDTRNKDICQRLMPHNDRIFQKCGAGLNTVFTAPKLTWLAENKSGLYNRAYKAMVVPDYLIHFMTGVFATDYTYGSRTLLMDLAKPHWDKVLCELFSLSQEKLCPLIPQGSVAGHVSHDFSRLTGIPAGIPVITAGGDQQCGALGAGILDEGTLLINCGTGAFILGMAENPVLNNPHMICNAAAVPGKYMLEANVLCSAAALNWFLEQLCPELLQSDAPYDRINEMAAAVPAGSHGLFCIPHFQGCGSRDWNPNAAAAFLGLTLKHTKTDMIRALYEGLAAEITKSIQVFPSSSGRPRRIYLAGGLSKSPVFNQIISDMTGHSVTVYENPQATAIGAFISASVTLGLFEDYTGACEAVRGHDHQTVYEPISINHAIYQEYLKRSENLYRALKYTYDSGLEMSGSGPDTSAPSLN